MYDVARSMEAIVLAAGSGSRLGGPKWAIEVAGTPLVLLHVARLAEAGCARILVIARPERVDELSRLHPDVLASSAAEPSGSLAVGVRALASMSPEHLVWITPVDVLPAKLTTLKSLEAALWAPGLESPGIGAASPRHAGRGGHPVLLRSSALEPYRRGEPPTLRALLEGLGPRRVAVPVDDPAVLGDLDTPGDVLRATGAPLCFARER
jgi:molybdenum cofactor cytidylyltransferase